MNAPNPKFNPILFPLIVVLVFTFSIIGHYSYLAHEGHAFNLFGVIYATICFFVMHHVDPVPHNTYILVAQYLAALLICTSIFSLVFAKVKKAYLVYRIGITYRNHIVIFRLNNIGKTLAIELLQKGYKVIVVESDEQNPFMEAIKLNGGIVFTEKPTDYKTLKMAAVSYSRVCILTSNRDEINIEIAGTLASYLLKYSGRKKGDPHKIMVHINNTSNENLLKDYFDIQNEDDHYDLETFNVYESAAKKIYDTYSPYKYIDVADKESENAIAIIGFNDVAESFIVENMILSHYPDKERIKIYLVDDHADEKFNYISYKYPFFQEFIDLVPIKLINGTFFGNFTWSKVHIENLSKIKVVYVFGQKDAEIINISTNFRQFLYTQTLSISQVPIIACLPEDTGVLDLLNSNRESGETLSQVFSNKLNINTYRLITNTCTAEGLIEESETTQRLSKLINFFYAIKYEFAAILENKWNISNAVSITNLLEEELLGLPDKYEKLHEREIEKHLLTLLSSKTNIPTSDLYDNFSIEKHWQHLSYRKKDSNKYVARQIATKIQMLQYIGCTPINKQNITTFFPRLAPIEHIRWSAEKMVFNFKYGPYPTDKNEKYLLKEVLKIHDQLVSYEKLNEFDQEKDLNLFLMIPVLSIIKTNNGTK
ncbi:MAG: NAD-binding protein [Chitinophagaceae bacterium]|nr:NAD-binding protein [Chitinophagaceae bacterium]